MKPTSVKCRENPNDKKNIREVRKNNWKIEWYQNT